MPLRALLLALAAVLGLAAPALAQDAPAGEWLAGDGHVHTCFSHDAYCGPGDDNTGPEAFYSSGGTVGERFAEAAVKGLDFLVVSDHDDVRAWSDPAFGSQGILGVRAYEHSVDGGHAHILGARGRLAEEPVDAVAAAANRDGALFQVNHPSYRGEQELRGCDDVAAGSAALHWKHGFRVRPDTIEVWNPTALLRPAETFWECWLQRGVRVPATAGSDSHGGNQANVALPTLWVLARERTEAAVLEAIRAGRTTITRLPPRAGAARLLLEADADRDGDFEATMGDTVAPGSPMRARTDGLIGTGAVRVRASGETLVEQRVLPGGEVRFAAPGAPGWVRATLVQPEPTAGIDPNCRQDTPGGSSGLDLCSADLSTTAMTSPVYVEAVGGGAGGGAAGGGAAGGGAGGGAGAGAAGGGAGGAGGGSTGGGSSPGGEGGGQDEPDDDPPLPAVLHSSGGAAPPTIPPQPPSADRRPALAPPAVSLRVVRLRGRRLRVSWAPAGWRFDVQRRTSRGWRTLRVATTETQLTMRVARRSRRLTFRVRPRAVDGRPGRWVAARPRR